MPRQQKPLLDRLMNTSTGKVVHSSGYGVAQNPGRIGTTSAQSFKERLAVDRNREFIGRYKDARVMRESRNALPQAKSFEQGIDTSQTGDFVSERAVQPGSGAKPINGALASAAERAKMAARFEPAKPMSGGTAPPPRRNPGI